MTMTISKPAVQQPDNSPLAQAKRIVYEAGLPAVTVPFFQQVLARLERLEAEVTALRGGPQVTGVEVR